MKSFDRPSEHPRITSGLPQEMKNEERTTKNEQSGVVHSSFFILHLGSRFRASRGTSRILTNSATMNRNLFLDGCLLAIPAHPIEHRRRSNGTALLFQLLAQRQDR